MEQNKTIVETHASFDDFLEKAIHEKKKSFFPGCFKRPRVYPFTEEQCREADLSESTSRMMVDALDEYEQAAKDELMAEGLIQEAIDFEVKKPYTNPL